MITNKTIGVLTATIIIAFSPAYSQTVQRDWADFLHYSAIGRLDLAIAHGQRLIQSNPDPLVILALADDNPRSYKALTDISTRSKNQELADIAAKILDILEEARYIKRTDSDIIKQEIARLSSTATGRVLAIERLRNASEFAAPHMLAVMADPARSNETANVAAALGQLNREAVKPLVAALQTPDGAVAAEIIRALGSIRSPEALPYLKFVIEQNASALLVTLARNSINEIDPAAENRSAAQLFADLAMSYFNRDPIVDPSKEGRYAKIWLLEADRAMIRAADVERAIYNDMMAMRCSEWALKADANMGEAIGIWLAAYLRAESTGLRLPDYFGPYPPHAKTYATIASPDYVQRALALAISENNAYMALVLVDALAETAGEAFSVRAVAADQPLVMALRFDDRAVRYSAAIAIAAANPRVGFKDSELVVQLLAEALAAQPSQDWPQEIAGRYNHRAITAMRKLGQKRNSVLNLVAARRELIAATRDARVTILLEATRVLAMIDDAFSQRAVAAVALDESNAVSTRIVAYGFLADSIKAFGNLLTEQTVNAFYDLVQSDQTDPAIRSAAAVVHGSLNLPSVRGTRLILDQAKN